MLQFPRGRSVNQRVTSRRSDPQIVPSWKSRRRKLCRSRPKPSIHALWFRRPLPDQRIFTFWPGSRAPGPITSRRLAPLCRRHCLGSVVGCHSPPRRTHHADLSRLPWQAQPSLSPSSSFDRYIMLLLGAASHHGCRNKSLTKAAQFGSASRIEKRSSGCRILAALALSFASKPK